MGSGERSSLTVGSLRWGLGRALHPGLSFGKDLEVGSRNQVPHPQALFPSSGAPDCGVI